MVSIHRTLAEDFREEDLSFEAMVRPRRLEEFVGQKRTKENLHVYISAAKERKEAIDHILFSGPPGLGKTTLSHIVAEELGVGFRPTTGPALERPGDLAGILSKLERGDVFFVDEIHRLSAPVEEYLYKAMEEFSIDIVIDQGPHARSVRIDLPRFTLIGSTTREGLLTAPLRARFGVLEKLEYYPWEDLLEIVRRTSRILGIEVEEEAARTIAQRARGTPRLANRFLKRIRDLAQFEGRSAVTLDVARRGLTMLGIDEHGLDIMDRKILQCLLQHEGGPLGLKTISISVGETEDTIEEVYEPYLIQQGFLKKTPRGRQTTSFAQKYVGINKCKVPPAAPNLFENEA